MQLGSWAPFRCSKVNRRVLKQVLLHRLLRNIPTLRLMFALFALQQRHFLTSIQRCSICYEMSNKIALVSLDFAGALLVVRERR